MGEINTKEKIRKAAIRLFAEKGYNGTATSEIAKLAGVAEGTVFKYYPRKKDLLKQVALETIEILDSNEIVPKAEQVLIQYRDSTVEDFLIAITKDRIMLLEQNKMILKAFFVEMLYHEEIREYFTEILNKNILGIGHKIVQTIKSKIEVDDYSDEDLLRELISMVMGIALH